MSDFIRRRPLVAGLIAIFVLALIISSFPIVPETKQAVVVRFGKPVRILNRFEPGRPIGAPGAGISWRIPFAEQVVVGAGRGGVGDHRDAGEGQRDPDREVRRRALAEERQRQHRDQDRRDLDQHGRRAGVDALLPGEPPASPVTSADLVQQLRPLADATGRLPVWTRWWPERDVGDLFSDAGQRASVERGQRRLPLAYLESAVPSPAGWERLPAAYLGFGDGAVQRSVPDASLMAVATAAAGLLGAIRWTQAKGVDFGAPMISTQAGAFPPGLMTNLFRGFDVCLLITAPMLLGLSPVWSLTVAAIAALILLNSMDAESLRAKQAEQQAKDDEKARAQAERESRAPAPRAKQEKSVFEQVANSGVFKDFARTAGREIVRSIFGTARRK